MRGNARVADELHLQSRRRAHSVYIPLRPDPVEHIRYGGPDSRGGRHAQFGGKDDGQQLSYFPDRSIASVTLGNGLVEASTQNSRLQITGRKATVGTVVPMNLTFGYNAAGSNNGNMTSQQIVNSSGLNVTQTYSPDAYNRLSSMSESSTGLSQTYSYDAYGNRAVTGGYVPNSSLTPFAINQFSLNQWNGAGSYTASYDAVGNQTKNNGTGNVFTYDGENRMVSANIANTGAVNYTYDAEGRRVQKNASTGNLTTYYVYDATDQVAAEYTTQTQPYYGEEYFTDDHLGSTRLLTDGNGLTIRRYDYLPFGEEIPAGVYSRGSVYGSATYPNSDVAGDEAGKKFTGKTRDTETGLDYFGARYFSSAQGRFTSPDEFKGAGCSILPPGLARRASGRCPMRT